MTALVEARKIVVRRGGRVVVREATLSLFSGEAMALVGPNAAGKSTLIKTLAGLLKPESGEVLLDGQDLTRWSRDALAQAVGLVTGETSGGLLTVFDRVALGRYPHRGPFQALEARDYKAVDRALDLAGVRHLAGRVLQTLSAGERELAALARGLAQEPRLLLLDEPGAHLDIGHQLQLFRVLNDVRAAGVTVLAVVHDLQRAATWAERMTLMAEGRIEAAGTPFEVLGSEACRTAFGVNIKAHETPGVKGPIYTFEAMSAPD